VNPQSDRRGRRALRVGVVVVVLAAAIYALSTQLSSVRTHLGQLSWTNVLAAEGALLLGLGAGLLAWRVLLTELGSRLPLAAAAQIFYIGQVAKYLPGSVWPVVTQMQLGQRHEVPRRRSAAAALVAMVISVLAGLLVASACAPVLLRQVGVPLEAGAVVVLLVGLATCHPRVLNRLLARGMRLLRQPPLEHGLSGRAIAQAVALSAGT